MKVYFILILIAVLLVSGCTQSTDQPPATGSSQLTSLEAKLVGTWSIARSTYKADSGGIWPTPDHIYTIGLKADKTWIDDKSNKGTWSVKPIEEDDWDVWSWDTSAAKPENKLVLDSGTEASGWIDESGSKEYFWLFYRFDGNDETALGWIQLYFEKTSDRVTITPSQPTGSQGTGIAGTVNIPDIKNKLLGEWRLGYTSRKLALRDGTWELLPAVEVGGSGTWELKDVTRSDIEKWKEDGTISDDSKIADKKIVFYNRVCGGGVAETENVPVFVADLGISFNSCGVGWTHL